MARAVPLDSRVGRHCPGAGEGLLALLLLTILLLLEDRVLLGVLVLLLVLHGSHLLLGPEARGSDVAANGDGASRGETRSNGRARRGARRPSSSRTAIEGIGSGASRNRGLPPSWHHMISMISVEPGSRDRRGLRTLSGQDLGVGACRPVPPRVSFSPHRSDLRTRTRLSRCRPRPSSGSRSERGCDPCRRGSARIE